MPDPDRKGEGDTGPSEVNLGLRVSPMEPEASDLLGRIREPSHSSIDDSNSSDDAKVFNDAGTQSISDLEEKQQKQNIDERKKYAERLYWMIAIWLTLIMTLLFLQGFGARTGWFTLADSVLIAVATTTTASVTVLLALVMRYLFPRS